MKEVQGQAGKSFCRLGLNQQSPWPDMGMAVTELGTDNLMT